MYAMTGQQLSATKVLVGKVSLTSNLARHLDIASQELAEQRGDGTTAPPVYQGMEYQLVASVCVFLPTRELVVDREGHAFLEASVVVRGKADDETVNLQPQRDVEVLLDRQHLREG